MRTSYPAISPNPIPQAPAPFPITIAVGPASATSDLPCGVLAPAPSAGLAGAEDGHPEAAPARVIEPERSFGATGQVKSQSTSACVPRFAGRRTSRAGHGGVRGLGVGRSRLLRLVRCALRHRAEVPLYTAFAPLHSPPCPLRRALIAPQTPPRQREGRALPYLSDGTR